MLTLSQRRGDPADLDPVWMQACREQALDFLSRQLPRLWLALGEERRECRIAHGADVIKPLLSVCVANLLDRAMHVVWCIPDFRTRV